MNNTIISREYPKTNEVIEGKIRGYDETLNMYIINYSYAGTKRQIRLAVGKQKLIVGKTVYFRINKKDRAVFADKPAE